MRKFLNTILLSTTLICCSNSYSLDANDRYNILYDPIDINTNLNKFLFGTNYEVGGSTNLSTDNGYQLGQLYFKKNDSTPWQPLLDEEGRPYFDLAAVVNNPADSVISNYITVGGWNLIIRNHSNKTYTLNNNLTLDGGNINLIIPSGITLKQSESGAENIMFKSGCNNTVLIFGKMTPNANGLYKSIVDFGEYQDPQNVIMMQDSKVILAPEAEFGKGANYGNNSVGSNTYDTKFVLYPGSKTTLPGTNDDYNINISSLGHLYLDRFTKTTTTMNMISSIVNSKIHVVYPTSVNSSSYKLHDNSDNPKNTITDYFPNLKFTGKLEDKKEGVNYSFEDAQAPLIPVMNEELNKAVLGINPANDMAKYDAKLWDECKLNEGKYSFVKYYNKPANKGNYFNTDDAHKLFKDVNKSDKPEDDPLKLETNKVFFGLLGSRNITLDTAEGTVYLYGDNSEYTGTINIPDGVTSVHLDKNSLVHITQNGSALSNSITFYLLGDNKLYLNKYDTTLNINFDNTTETNSSGNLEIVDNSSPKKTEVTFGGDLSKYEGKITIPTDINEVGIKDSDPLFKIKHKDHDDLSDLTYVLNSDLEVDLKNIENSTFEMSLQSSGNTITLTDSSNATKINKVTFSGDNKGYKKSDGDNNSGIVNLTPDINEVEFKNAPDSFVNLKGCNETKTALKNNVLSSETSEIKVSPNNYSGNITYKNTDDRDEVENIWKYNVEGVTWNTSTLEDCFKNGSKLLDNINLDKIIANLVGSDNITIKTDSKEIVLLGDNSGYTGIMTIPNNINYVYLKKQSIAKIKQENTTYETKVDLDSRYARNKYLKLKFHFIDHHIIEEQEKQEDEDGVIEEIPLFPEEGKYGTTQGNETEVIKEIPLLL